MRFFVTGFGPFEGVNDNPTQRLVELLDERRPGGAASTDDNSEHDDYTILGTAVLEVAAQASRDWLTQLYDSQQLAAAAADGPVVLLHLGIDVSSTQFKLEAQAVNDATFRCPDQRGWQPRGSLIDDHPGCLLATRLLTDLDVATLADQLAERRQHDVSVSLDAGRFVCNLTYYLSLLHSQKERQRKRVPLHALFVHVPPLAAVPLEQQYSFLLDVLAGVASMLAPSTSSAGSGGADTAVSAASGGAPAEGASRVLGSNRPAAAEQPAEPAVPPAVPVAAVLFT